MTNLRPLIRPVHILYIKRDLVITLTQRIICLSESSGKPSSDGHKRGLLCRPVTGSWRRWCDIGTRFLVADEIWAHGNYKDLLVPLREADTALMMQSVRNTVRALRNDTTNTVNELERTHAGDFSVLKPHVAGVLGKQAYISGDASIGALSLGQAVAFVDRREPLATIVDRIEAEMASAIEALSKFQSRSQLNAPYPEHAEGAPFV